MLSRRSEHLGTLIWTTTNWKCHIVMPSESMPWSSLTLFLQVQNITQSMEVLDLRTYRDLQYVRDTENLMKTVDGRLKTASENPRSINPKSFQVQKHSLTIKNCLKATGVRGLTFHLTTAIWNAHHIQKTFTSDFSVKLGRTKDPHNEFDIVTLFIPGNPRTRMLLLQ